MSELKVYQVICTDDIDRNEITENFSAPDFLAYDADEADKVIAELKEQVHDYAQGLYVMQARAEIEFRHQKYKRCLAMAKWCDEVMMSCELRGYAVHRIWANRHQWAMRWKYRWLELAEKFKEADQ